MATRGAGGRALQHQSDAISAPDRVAGGSRKRWRITTDEFKRVAYATLIKPQVGVPLCGVAHQIVYDELKEVRFLSLLPLARNRADHNAGTAQCPGPIVCQ